MKKVFENIWLYIRSLKSYLILFLSSVIVFALMSMLIVPVLSETSIVMPKMFQQPDKDKIAKLQMSKLKMEVSGLQKRLERLTPSTPYLIINTSDNRYSLYNKKKLVRKGLCSTGSDVKLIHGEKTNWTFKTPKGISTIHSKTKNPVWKKPDWAFVEEGLPIPPPNDNSRFEYGVLGDYALSLGDGYLIHGTLYKRFLGMPVTHGCVRLNDEDLEVVYNTLILGSKVYIY